jgi:hypothetical protein
MRRRAPDIGRPNAERRGPCQFLRGNGEIAEEIARSREPMPTSLARHAVFAATIARLYTDVRISRAQASSIK